MSQVQEPEITVVSAEVVSACETIVQSQETGALALRAAFQHLQTSVASLCNGLAQQRAREAEIRAEFEAREAKVGARESNLAQVRDLAAQRLATIETLRLEAQTLQQQRNELRQELGTVRRELKELQNAVASSVKANKV